MTACFPRYLFASEVEEHADCFCEDPGPDSTLDMKECVRLLGEHTHVRACSNNAVGMKRNPIKVILHRLVARTLTS